MSGADARLWLTLRNDGRQIDSLVRVSTPAAARAEIRWDKDCDGTAEKVPALPLWPAGPDLVDAPSAAPLFDSYRVRLVDLTEVVRAGTTIPVKFVFEKAGQVTVETIVHPSVPRPEPSTRCVPG